jgi:hypothetical protein
MPQPWDRPPFPKRGDDDEHMTYAHVGRIMTRWESLEFELSRLYSWFDGALDDTDKMREYGTGRIFRDRADALGRKADQFFMQHPDQGREGEFSELLSRARLFANRRNDIAHGILFTISRITFFRDKLKPNLLHREHYAIIPPLYAMRHHDQQGLPEFAYTSVEMRRIGTRIWRLQKEVERYRLRATGAEQPSKRC